MILASPLLLLGLLVLPVIWWLLRAVPPAPRVQNFPAMRLLLGLRTQRQEAQRAPPWLLILRLLAGGLLVLGLAQPVLVQDRAPAAASRNLLVVLDDGWAAAADWPQRIGALDALLDQAGRAGQRVRLLATARDERGLLAPPGPPAAPRAQRAAIDARRPRAWNTDRAAAAKVLDGLPAGSASVVYLSDGLATTGDRALAAALRRIGPVAEWRADGSGVRVLLAPRSQPQGLVVRVGALPAPNARPFTVRAEDARGGTLALASGTIAAGRDEGEATLGLPAELRNRLARLVLAGEPGPGGLRLLDEGDRRRPVGLISTGGFANAPLVGSLFYVERALSPDTELREGDVPHLLSRHLSVIVAPDGALQNDATRQRLADWVRKGGMLIRFAGPRLAARQAAGADAEARAGPGAGADADASDTPADADDGAPPGAVLRPGAAIGPGSGPGLGVDLVGETLLPTPLLDGARTLGGAMSWNRPATLATFSPDSPFAGLPQAGDVSVSRQVLARPVPDLDAHTWARLSDGTPLVTHANLGGGQVVLFHVTSTPDWSTLPFSGVFVAMLHRLVELSVGLRPQGGSAVLAPVSVLDGDGLMTPPPPAARGLPAREFGHVAASPVHPPGLYGPLADRRALNVGDALPPLAVSAAIGTPSSLAGRVPDRPLGPWLLAAALLLLLVDLLATLRLRGLLAPPRPGFGRSAAALLLAALLGLGAMPATSVPAAAAGDVPAAALQTRLAYVVTGDQGVDALSREGLEGLSSYVNARTSAVLGPPDAVRPGRDDLAFYPMLYWPITANQVADPAAIAALNSYMSHGGILLIDTRGSEGASSAASSGEASFTGLGASQAALRRATAGLDIPPLMPVDANHVLAHSFYLLHSFPGRYVGGPVWVAAGADQGNDNVSPLIIGSNDWASAWAVDAAGDTPYAVIPGGEAQRTLAYRFGVNAVIYALTGNYKSDQVHVPALLQRLGE